MNLDRSAQTKLKLGATELVIVSDVHLVTMDEPNAQLMLSCLTDIAAQPVEYLVMLGDIFDFCLGSNRYFQKRFAPLGAALEAVAASGTEVFFVEGNHEFDIAKMPWRGVTFIKEGNLTITTSKGDTIQFAHGDMIYSSKTYQRFRRVVKSPVVKGVASILPGSFINSFALKNSDLSRSQDKYREIKHQEILGAANHWLNKSEAKHGIFGHFHVPYAEPRQEGQGTLLGLDSWEKPNFLILRHSEFHRIYFDKAGMPIERIAQSFFPD